jgi:hypothetical protein
MIREYRTPLKMLENQRPAPRVSLLAFGHSLRGPEDARRSLAVIAACLACAVAFVGIAILCLP